MFCIPCELVGKRTGAETILNGFAVCMDHYTRWAEGTMTFKIDNMLEDYHDEE